MFIVHVTSVHAWVPAGMGKRKCFCALVVTAKCSVGELFVHIFTIGRQLLGA